MKCILFENFLLSSKCVIHVLPVVFVDIVGSVVICV